MTNHAELPEAIKRQLEEAEALEQQLYGQPAPEGNTEAPTEAPSEAPTEAPAEAVTQPEPVVDDEEETFRRRYEVLQGKYSAEVPRLHAQLRDATAQIQQMQAEFAAMQQQLTQKPEPQPVKDNDAETFGEDLVEAMDRRAERMAQQLVAKEMSQMQAYIKQLESKLGSVDQQVAVSAQDRFYGKLAQLVPDYEAVNGEQGFLNWLGEIDPVYGLPRQAALDNAAQSLDVDRVAAIFSAYKQLTGKQVADQQKQQVRKELERQVAPSATRAAANAPQQGKIWTRADYEHAYDPRTLRELGSEKTLALQAEADLAVSEGRVQW